jgi:hypothetical protein
VIKADDDYRERVESKKLMELIEEAVTLYIDDELVEQLLSELVLKNKSVDTDKAEKTLDYLRHPSLDMTKEVMRGIVSL